MPISQAPQTRAAHSPSLSATALASLLASFPLLLFPDLQRRPWHAAVVIAGAAGAGATTDEAIGAEATTAGLEMGAALDTAGTGGSAGAGLSTAPELTGAATFVDDPPPAPAPVSTVVPAPIAAPVPAAVPATVPAPGITPVKAVSAEFCSAVPAFSEEAVLPSHASPAPAGNPAKDPPPSLLVPVAPPPTISPPGPAHWLTGALPDGFAPIPLPPGQNSIKY